MFLGQPWPFSETGIESHIWISGRRKERWGERVRHDRWRSFGIRCSFFPPGLNDSFNAPRTCLLWILTPTHLYVYSCIEIGTYAYLINTVDIWAWRLIDETDCLCLWPVKHRGPGGLPKDVPNPQQIALNWILTLLTPVAVYSTPIGNDWHCPRVLISIWIMRWLFHLHWMVWRISWPTLDQSVSCGAHVNLIDWPPMTPWGPQEYGSMAMITQVAWCSPAVTSCSTGIIELFSWN